MANLRSLVEAWDRDERGEIFPEDDYLREDVAERRYSDLLDRVEALYRFKRSHDQAVDGPIEAHVMRWLENVSVAERPLYLLLASKLMFYTLEELRILVCLAAQRTVESLSAITDPAEQRSWMRQRLLFVPMSDSGAILVRELRHRFDLSEHMCPMSLDHADETNVREAAAIVIVDDFIGTGADITDRHTEFDDKVRHLGGSSLVYLCAVAFADGKLRVEREISIRVYAGEELTKRHKAFDEQSAILTNSLERGMLRTSCAHRGASLEGTENALGFGGCQLVVVMPDNVPDNSLPVIWSDTNSWRPLFRRDVRQV